MTSGQPSRARTDALILALAALVAALVAAIGPAERVHTTYEWPPAPTSSEKPRLWYAPLLLARHTPERIDAEIPCDLPRSPARGDAATVLATARSPERVGGLRLVRQGDTLDVRVGARTYARVRLARASAERCRHRLTLGDRRWSLSGAGAERSGALEHMPAVSGLFSELDLGAASVPRIAVTTSIHATRTTTRQTVAWLTAGLLAVGALLVVALSTREAARRPTRRLGRALRKLTPADAVVIAALAGWWVLAPAFYDDGWTSARLRQYSRSGGFSNYYDTLAVNLPNGFWLEWLQHWVIESSNALVLLRVPSLACLLALWFLCRWIVATVLCGRAERHAALWPMTAAFLAGALAWGMTLRPEPVTALLVTGTLGAAVAFRRRPSGAPLTAAAALVPLALTAHHAGIVALAPLLAIAAPLGRWARSERRLAAALAVSSAALLVLLFTLGADLQQRLVDIADTHALNPNGDDWYREYIRYERLGTFVYATPLRRASVALAVIVVLFYVLRKRRGRAPLDTPALALALGLGLLVFTPTKHPWHFGALVGVAAVAAGCEAVRLRQEALRTGALGLRGLVLVALLLAGIGWAWRTRGPWNALDLRMISWVAPFEDTISLGMLCAFAVIFTLAVAAFQRRPEALSQAPWKVASWAAVLLTVPIAVFTVVVLGIDAARTQAWTLPRQNLHALVGEAGCGLGDELRLDDRGGRGSMSLAAAVGSEPTLVFADTLTYFPCLRLPSLTGGVVQPPSYVVGSTYSRAWLGLGQLLLTYPTSPLELLGDLYRLDALTQHDVADPLTFHIVALERKIPDGIELRPIATEWTS